MVKPKLVTFMPIPRDIQISHIFSGRIDPLKVDLVTVSLNSSEKEVYKAVAGATVILTPPIKHFNRKLLEHAKGVKLFQVAGAGYDHIDIEAATEFKIPVANTPGATQKRWLSTH